MSATRRFRSAATAMLAILAAVVVASPASSAVPVPGSAGTDTARPATDSQMTVRGRGPFADLEVTVNQTEDLVNQAVSLTWRGGSPTRQGPGRFAGDYLQVMQCWGDDDGTVAANPGPPPEQCVQGATAGTFGGLPGGVLPNGFATSRIISRSDWAGFDTSVGFLDSRTTNVWRPFRAVDGTVVDVHTDPAFQPSVAGGSFWLNPFFNIVTTNEVAGAPTGRNGEGAELVEVLTGVESSGLGCGQRVQPTAGGQPRIPRCWLVVVPRGEPAAENVGTPFVDSAAQDGVFTSPLSPAAWANRIAIPLEFNPVDSACSIADDDRRIVGSELVLPAVASWQAALCATPGLPPFSYANVGDPSARLQLANPSPGGPGMVVVSRPLTPTAVDESDPVVYAPVSLSGTVIGVNVERNPRPDAGADAQALAGVRVADVNLTPRLVAKLLTQSYRLQVEIKEEPPYPWLEGNPPHLGRDPDFLQFNPEFELLEIASGKSFGGLVLPAGNSDAARQVWEWVLADPEAKAWLDGGADPWGMSVNPVYATTAEANPSGFAFADPVPESFPKSDPYCYQAPSRGANGAIVPAPLCGTDWLPYTRTLGEAARIARAADDGAKIVEDVFAVSADRVWVRDIPQFLGRRAILSFTDTASASQFGLQAARLSRAGDDGAERAFIAPDVAGLTAGAEAMRPRGEPAVREPDPTVDAASAYPLTTLTYAAATPLSLDEASRREYAAFVDYASGPGQVPGFELGQLPAGYAPLPEALRAQAVAAAAAIRDAKAPVVPVDGEPATTPPGPLGATPPGPLGVAPASGGGAPSGGTGFAPSTPDTNSATPFPSSSSSSPSGAPFPAPGLSPVVATVSPPTGVTVRDEVAAPPTALRTDQVTSAVPVGANRLVIVVLGAIALLSALGALEITKGPRRAAAGPTTASAAATPVEGRA